VKTAISIPNPVFDAGEKLARRMKMNRSELYSQAIAAYVNQHSEEDVTEALNHVYEKEDAALDPVLARLQSASLPKERW